MCMGGGGSTPTPVKAQVPVETPRMQDAEVSGARKDERKRLRAMSGRTSTIATSSMGVTTPANVSGKVLTGQ